LENGKCGEGVSGIISKRAHTKNTEEEKGMKMGRCKLREKEEFLPRSTAVRWTAWSFTEGNGRVVEYIYNTDLRQMILYGYIDSYARFDT
jgi:hypothetical protein